MKAKAPLKPANVKSRVSWLSISCHMGYKSLLLRRINDFPDNYK